MKKIGWFLHPDHGYMYRGQIYNSGWQSVVTSLCLNTREIEENEALWEANKSRLYVNAGCGAVAADGMQVGDHNPAFRPIAASRVPAWIVKDFIQYA